MSDFNEVGLESNNDAIVLLVSNKDSSSVTDPVNWNAESTEGLLLYYLENVQYFRGYLQEMAYTKWEYIANQLSQTTEACQARFEMLQNTYFEIVRSQIQEDGKVVKITDVDWPYFDIFLKICQFDGTPESTTGTNTKEPGEAESDLALLEYYLKHKHLFRSAEFGGKIRLWSYIATGLHMSPEQCATRFLTVKHSYNSLLETPNKADLSGVEMYNTPFYRFCDKVFKPSDDVEENTVDEDAGSKKFDTKETTRKMNVARKTRWEHCDVRSVLDYYSENIESFKSALCPKELWKPMAEILGRTTKECYQKIAELLKKHKHYRRIRKMKPNAKICWRYFDTIEEMYRKNNFEDYLGSADNGEDSSDACDNDLGMQNEGSGENHEAISSWNASTNEDLDLLKSDDDYICIIVAPKAKKTKHFASTTPVLEINSNDKISKPSDQKWKTKAISLSDDHNDENCTNQYDKIDPLTLKASTKKWSKKLKTHLLRMYKNYLTHNKKNKIKEKDLWTSIGFQLGKSPGDCHATFNRLKQKNDECYRQTQCGEEVNWPYFNAFNAIKKLESLFNNDTSDLKEPIVETKPVKHEIQDTYVKNGVDSNILSYYLDNLEEFVSPKFYKSYVWEEMGKALGENAFSCKRKFDYLHNFYKELDQSNKENKDQLWPYFKTFQLINAKQSEIKEVLKNDPTLIEPKASCEMVGFDIWDDTETKKLLHWFASKVDQFRSPKYINKYLWREAEQVLDLSAGRCSKKMRDLRGIYRWRLKALLNGTPNPNKWKYFSLCSKIYGMDLDDPFLARTKRTREELKADSEFKPGDQGSLTKRRTSPLKKRRWNRKAMQKPLVKCLLNYYIDNYDRLFKNPSGTEKKAWSKFAKGIGFTTLACKKQLALLTKQYNGMLWSNDFSLLEDWPYRRLMEKVSKCRKA